MSAPWDNSTLTKSASPLLDNKCKGVCWNCSNNDTFKFHLFKFYMPLGAIINDYTEKFTMGTWI